MEGIVDLIQNEDIELARFHLLMGKLECILGVFPMLLVGVGISLNTTEPFSRGNQFHRAAHPLHAVPFTGIEVSLHELNNTDPHIVATCSYSNSQSGRGLTLTVAGYHDHKPLFLFGIQSSYFYHRQPQ